jgi:hypothetical protein
MERYFWSGILLVIAAALAGGGAGAVGEGTGLRIEWEKNLLTVREAGAPDWLVEVNYLEAFCRPGSTDRDWRETTIPHRTEKVDAAADGRSLRLRSTLSDGVVVEHALRAGEDEVDFRLTATNPTAAVSEAHWAQPCMRVDRFTGVQRVANSEAYLPQSFIFLDGQLTRMPTPQWATRARYTPGQTWCPAHVPRTDVNPRPLNPRVPSNGLIGCYSADGKRLLATAWEPYQELFQGVVVCLHADFRLGGLKPGETKRARGKIYLGAADVPALLAKYARDFPEHGLRRPAGAGGG